MPIKLRIIEPEKIIAEAQAEQVCLMTQKGSLGVLPGHIPMAVHLKEGEVSFDSGKIKQKVAIKGGFARVLPDSVTVFTY